MDGLGQYVGTSEKWAFSLLRGLGTRKTVPGENPANWQELWVMYLITHLRWKEKRLEVKIFIHLWSVVNVLANWLGPGKEKDWKMGNKI